MTPQEYYEEGKTLLTIAQATMNESTSAEAFELLEKSAELGHAPAYLLLAECHENAICTDYDEDAAYEAYQKAADLGDELGAITYATRAFYAYYDHAAALEYTQKALTGIYAAQALYLIGLIYYHGEAVDTDYAKSFEMHHQAAESGNTDAMFELYVYYSQGIGCEANPATAFEWNKKAADLGHYRACFNMGWFYETGTNVDANIEQAFRYYSKASENGNGKATAYCGALIQRGTIRPAQTFDAAGNWDEERAKQLAETYYDKAINEQAYYDLDAYLEALEIDR